MYGYLHASFSNHPKSSQLCLIFMKIFMQFIFWNSSSFHQFKSTIISVGDQFWLIPKTMIYSPMDPICDNGKIMNPHWLPLKTFNSLILSSHTWNFLKNSPSWIFTACRSDLVSSWESLMCKNSELSCWKFSMVVNGGSWFVHCHIGE